MIYYYKKRKRLGQPRQALEGRPVKSFFDFIGRTETTRGARRWSWPILEVNSIFNVPKKKDSLLTHRIPFRKIRFISSYYSTTYKRE